MKYKLDKNKIIKNSKGNIFKLLSKKVNCMLNLVKFFSEVKPNKFKGWKLSDKHTQLLTVIKGAVEFKLKKNLEIKTKTISFPSNLSMKFPQKPITALNVKIKQHQ